MTGKDSEKVVTFDDLKLSHCSLCKSKMNLSKGYSIQQLPRLKPSVFSAMEKLSINFFDYNKMTCSSCTTRYIYALNTCKIPGRFNKDTEDAVRREFAKKMQLASTAIIKDATNRENLSLEVKQSGGPIPPIQLKRGDNITWALNKKAETLPAGTIIIIDGVVSDTYPSTSESISAVSSPIQQGRSKPCTSTGQSGAIVQANMEKYMNSS